MRVLRCNCEICETELMSIGLMSNSNLKLLGGDERMERTDSALSFDPKGSLGREMAWLRQCLPIILQVVYLTSTHDFISISLQFLSFIFALVKIASLATS